MLLLLPTVVILMTSVVAKACLFFDNFTRIPFFFVGLPLFFAPAGVLSIILGFVFEQWRYKRAASLPSALAKGFVIFCINFLIFAAGFIAFSS